MDKDHPAKDVALKTGDRIKDFRLVDTAGVAYRLAESIEQQPLVVVFYRGDW